jgi:hypothetical protein
MANALNNSLEMLDVLQENIIIYLLRVRQIQVENQLPTKGNTIKSLLHITYSMIFSDAAHKTRKASGLPAATSTRIGVYCKI